MKKQIKKTGLKKTERNSVTNTRVTNVENITVLAMKMMTEYN